MATKRSTFSCPVCDRDVPVKAKACPHCGACEKSGWNEDARASDGLDLPEDDFDYERFKEQEFGSLRRWKGKELLWKATAVVLLIVTILMIASNLLFR